MATQQWAPDVISTLLVCKQGISSRCMGWVGFESMESNEGETSYRSCGSSLTTGGFFLSSVFSEVNTHTALANCFRCLVFHVLLRPGKWFFLTPDLSWFFKFPPHCSHPSGYNETPPRLTALFPYAKSLSCTFHKGEKKRISSLPWSTVIKLHWNITPCYAI